MRTLIFGEKQYDLDDDGFLTDYDQWDKAFADGLAPSLEIPRLCEKHWEVIHFIRDSCQRYGKCPSVYQTCRSKNLAVRDLKRLFPTGYLRGACKLAGITYKEGYHGFTTAWAPGAASTDSEKRPFMHGGSAPPSEKTYLVNVRGFLVNPDDWDEDSTGPAGGAYVGARWYFTDNFAAGYKHSFIGCCSYTRTWNRNKSGKAMASHSAWAGYNQLSAQ